MNPAQIPWAVHRRRGIVMTLLGVVLLLLIARQVVSQTTNDPIALSYQAFSQLTSVYRAGGQAPDLVVRLNQALGMIQDARIKQAQGDIPDANRLEDQARSNIQSVLNSIPAAETQAIHDSNSRTFTVVASVPTIVVLSTFIFYVGLRSWRYYEKMKLYEMRIVEKKAED